MQTNVLEYLEKTAAKKPDKLAFADELTELTFRDVYVQARAAGSFLCKKGIYKEPVVVFMRRGAKTVAAFLGVVYAGCHYVPLDEDMPRFRIEMILKTVRAKVMICDRHTRPLADGLEYGGEICLYDEISNGEADAAALSSVRGRQIDTDPIYVVFTSGSTGVPKGVTACHRCVINYIEGLCEVLKSGEDNIYGNQGPLYFDACLKDIFPTLKYGATTYVIPKQLFMFPVKLVEFLNRYRINTVCWVVSAMTMISSLGALKKIKPKYLHTIAFAGEVFPINQFNVWRSALPAARFINLYGPTETTGICCFYEADREFEPGDALPAGRPLRNTDVFLLDEDNKVPPLGREGEICVRGSSLALGYYRDIAKTEEVFVRNPLNGLYPEFIYRTGDVGKYNERGELIFLFRKDRQIKHMGRRIELGEIEAAANMNDRTAGACCLYDAAKNKIVLYFAGGIDKAGMASFLKEKLPAYMVPNVICRMDRLPLTPNGKIDRRFLTESYLKGK